ncbi:DUF3298 and DUF4163 domain-containing protein [Sinanaerobacter chloroacetimidivorans]|uniref:DUF3298 and DUF4163 domain-containing protein n=1 Tax=Sinanaerobacter chloroacetimidivorans TaxID=2818044 RepID=A0A8J8B2A2_9FIRM|nr:DUF3298 and DUF4163 domain-containing protein [Sinanaerobacter chloroacetimidivorans]MBR0599079.1 DUF3298 and DUF4163 domain-containing protein [Sinanaerobacter chloroacetimidivorans]
MNQKSSNNDRKRNHLPQLKQIYESPPIPQQLSKVIQEVMKQAEKEKQEEISAKKLRGTWKIWPGKRFAGVAAAAVLFIAAFGVGVNTSESFAGTMEDIPVLSNLVKVLTVREIRDTEESIDMNIKIPGIAGLKDKELQNKINREVYEKVSNAVEESKRQILADKEAWLATGGKEEDYRPMEIQVDYEVKSITNNILSFMVWKTQTGASAYFDEFYYNYDLNENRELTLEDLLGADYIDKANKQISEEIKERSKEEGAMYWDGSDGFEGFQTIVPEQSFYVNENGNPVIIFNKYEIAPGYMGIQEFEITK